MLRNCARSFSDWLTENADEGGEERMEAREKADLNPSFLLMRVITRQRYPESEEGIVELTGPSSGKEAVERSRE
jgi:hypothetical protein